MTRGSRMSSPDIIIETRRAAMDRSRWSLRVRLENSWGTIRQACGWLSGRMRELSTTIMGSAPFRTKFRRQSNMPSDVLGTLGFAMGSAWLSGINLYATVATLGLLQRFHLAHLPGDLDFVQNWWVIIV